MGLVVRHDTYHMYKSSDKNRNLQLHDRANHLLRKIMSCDLKLQNQVKIELSILTAVYAVFLICVIKSSHQGSVPPEGWLCGALFWEAPEGPEAQEGPWAQEVLEDQEDLYKEKRTTY